MSLHDEFFKNRARQVFEGNLNEISVRPAGTRQNKSNQQSDVARNMQAANKAGQAQAQAVQQKQAVGQNMQAANKAGGQPEPAQTPDTPATPATPEDAGQMVTQYSQDILGWIKANNALKKTVLVILKRAIKQK